MALHCTRERRSRPAPWRLGRPGGIGLLAACLLIAPRAEAAAPRVVVTVKPLHSLVAGVMAGAGEPALIIRGAGSPHTYNLKPSEARMLEDAQAIFWIGESLETFMEKPLAALGAKAHIVEVGRAPGMTLLKGAEGVARDGGDEGGRAGHGHDAAGWDGHLWLDPGNAKVIARLAADELGELDPGNRSRYRDNAAALIARIDALDAELARLLAPVRDVPFVVFHDAYRYFERRYSLRAVGSITVSPERRPGARRVGEARERIRTLGARCVFSEPQFTSAIVGTLVEGTGARTGTLDPLGVDVPAGPDAWFALMRGLGKSLSDCLR